MDISVGKNSYISEKASLIGKIKIGNNSSVFPFASIRAETEPVTIGDGTNIQDNVTIHTDPSYPVIIGNHVSIGHNAIIHGSKIGNNCLIGMGAIIMNGCEIGNGSIIGAGTLLLENTKVESNSMFAGVPGKLRKRDPSYEKMAIENARAYENLISTYYHKD
ncbi:gamma carbonic anhydrase family protein [Caldiplasma sukawensis]